MRGGFGRESFCERWPSFWGEGWWVLVFFVEEILDGFSVIGGTIGIHGGSSPSFRQNNFV